MIGKHWLRVVSADHIVPRQLQCNDSQCHFVVGPGLGWTKLLLAPASISTQLQLSPINSVCTGQKASWFTHSSPVCDWPYWVLFQPWSGLAESSFSLNCLLKRLLHSLTRWLLCTVQLSCFPFPRAPALFQRWRLWYLLHWGSICGVLKRVNLLSRVFSWTKVMRWSKFSSGPPQLSPSRRFLACCLVWHNQ